MKTKFFEIRLAFRTCSNTARHIKNFPFKDINQLMKDTILKGEKFKGKLVRDGVCAVLYIHPMDECIERTGGFNRSITLLTKMAQHFTEMWSDLLSVDVYGYNDNPDADGSLVIWNWHYIVADRSSLQCELPETLQYHFSMKKTKPSYASRALLDFLIRNNGKTVRQLLQYH